MTEPVIFVKSNNLPLATPTEDEQNEFYSLRHNVMSKASNLSLNDSFTCEFRPKELLQGLLIFLHYIVKNLKIYDTLIKTGSEVEISVTADQVLLFLRIPLNNIKTNFGKSIGLEKITASSFDSVCHTKITNQSLYYAIYVIYRLTKSLFLPLNGVIRKKNKQRKCMCL